MKAECMFAVAKGLFTAALAASSEALNICSALCQLARCNLKCSSLHSALAAAATGTTIAQCVAVRDESGAQQVQACGLVLVKALAILGCGKGADLRGRSLAEGFVGALHAQPFLQRSSFRSKALAILVCLCPLSIGLQKKYSRGIDVTILLDIVAYGKESLTARSTWPAVSRIAAVLCLTRYVALKSALSPCRRAMLRRFSKALSLCVRRTRDVA
jgi:hypothetical protein